MNVKNNVLKKNNKDLLNSCNSLCELAVKSNSFNFIKYALKRTYRHDKLKTSLFIDFYYDENDTIQYRDINNNEHSNDFYVKSAIFYSIKYEKVMLFNYLLPKMYSDFNHGLNSICEYILIIRKLYNCYNEYINSGSNYGNIFYIIDEYGIYKDIYLKRFCMIFNKNAEDLIKEFEIKEKIKCL